MKPTEAQKLRKVRLYLNLTQKELADRINSSKSYISNIERGMITPSVGVFFKNINAMGMKVEVVKPLN